MTCCEFAQGCGPHNNTVRLVKYFSINWIVYPRNDYSLKHILLHIYIFYIGGPKVYDVTKYLDDHPGGAEVMLDVAGQDADEFFEDIGHSKEARNELKKYYIGDFKLDEAAIAALKAAAEKKKLESNSGASFMVVVFVAMMAILFGVYTQMK